MGRGRIWGVYAACMGGRMGENFYGDFGEEWGLQRESEGGEGIVSGYYSSSMWLLYPFIVS